MSSSVQNLLPNELPACLLHARKLPFIGQLAEANAANTELTIHRVRTPAHAATSVGTRAELRFPLRLDNHRLLCHGLDLLVKDFYFRNGMPISVSSARASSSVFAVVTTTTSMPRTLSILS